MKKVFLLTLVFTVLLGNTTIQAANLIVNLKAPKEIKGAEYGICISNYSFRNGYNSQFEDIYKSNNGKFNIELDPGRYMIAMEYPYAEPFYYHFYLKDKSSKVEFNVELDRLCIKKKIENVELMGDYNGWSGDNIIKLKYNSSKKNWYLPNSEIPENLTSFKLILPEAIYLQNMPTDSLNTWVGPANHYVKSKKDIIFNPADYKQGIPQPKISGTYDTTYNSLAEKLQDIYSKIYTPYYIKTKEELEDYKKSYQQSLAEINKLVDKTPNNLKWATINAQAEMIKLSTLGDQYYASNTKNSKLQKSIRESEAYITQYRNIAKLFRNIEFNNLSLCLSDINELWSIEYQIDDFDLYEELNIPYGYFKQKLVDALKVIDNQNLCGEIMWIKASSLRYNNPDKAIIAYNNILSKYPNYRNSKNGSIQKMLVGLKVKEGMPAPDFKLKSIKGNDLSLSSFKGKYVFIDFWGTWCGPCRGEIPNVKKLFETYQNEKLVVMGIAHDNLEELNKYISQNEIKYENALETPEVAKNYGINSWPTTFLIGPDGTILAKNLRGELIEQVKQFIK